MQYLGGKSRIAKEIAQVVAPQGFWWEPFCGGLSVSVQLAKFGPGLVSDANPALISLYTSVARGWLPPEALSLEEWREARRLPDSDPRKAFAGFGCSFGGRYFAPEHRRNLAEANRRRAAREKSA
jgi:DNA adenine methylase